LKRLDACRDKSTYGCRDTVFLNSKTKVKSARPGKSGKRWYKDVGLGFKTPKTAIEGNYIGTCGSKNLKQGRPNDGETRKHTIHNCGRLLRGIIMKDWIADSGANTDKKCPFTGLVSIRGRILTGTVVSTKMHRTLIIRREYLHFIPKYARYEKRHKNLAAHVSPAFRVEEGDQVTVGQCRPLSKTVSLPETPSPAHIPTTYGCCASLGGRHANMTL
jgi:small subunit ribosomal protein S11e